ncbi:MAG: thiol:disulfide interchange protein DsbA/DsbL [Candidatus Sedimenticola endophacoides]
MNRRVFAVVPLLLVSLFAFAAQAAPKFEEELHYFEVIPPQPGGEAGRVKVLEFFMYGCTHCFDLEPHVNAWKQRKPENVDVVLVPAMFQRPDIVMHAETFYALKLMGESERMHERIFEAIHVQNRNLRTQMAMEKLLEEHGVDIEAYRKAMKSFAVKTQANRAALLAKRFDIRGVPAIVVDGKYRTGGLHGDVMMEVTDYLIERVQQER